MSDPGIYRRRIRMRSQGDAVLASLEDDPHHFRVRLKHDGACVTEISAEAIRYPWATCTGAIARLEAFVGAKLADESTSIGAIADAREHCTHLFDLVGLGIAHVASARVDRQYDCAVPEPVSGPTEVTLRRDGEAMLAWNFRDGVIRAPERFAGVEIGRGFLRWCQANLDREEREAALVLRRAILIARSRLFDLDQLERAGSTGTPIGSCYSYSEERMPDALRMYGSQLEFTTRPETLLTGEPDP